MRALTTPNAQEYGEYLDADSALTFLLPISAEVPTTPPGSRQGRYHYFCFTDVETEALGEGEDLLMVTCL